MGEILVDDRLEIASGREFEWEQEGMGSTLNVPHTRRTYAMKWRMTVRSASYTVFRDGGGKNIRRQATCFREVPSSEVDN